MSIFTKPIEKINYEDVEAFCEQKVEEGFRVEYKRKIDNNKKLADEIASFANTYGGIIIVGVEDDDGKPITPIKGTGYETLLNEKFTSICLDNINPPYIPQIQICKNPDNENICVIVIMIEESDQTPHRTRNDTRTYIRVNKQKEPIEAPYEQVEWLRNRRQKAIENKKRLLKRSRERFLNFRLGKNTSSEREFYIVPHFPSKILFQLNEFEEIIEKTKFSFYQTIFPFNIFPEKSLTESRIFTFTKRKNNKDFVEYFELNQYGLVFNKQSSFEYMSLKKNNKINILFVLKQVILNLTYTKRFYDYVGYRGTLEIGHSMEGIINHQLTTFSYFADTIEVEELYDYGRSELDNRFY